MHIIAIDTTGSAASAALISTDKLIAQFTVNCGLTHSQTLLPMIDQMLAAAHFDKRHITHIACAAGPGSFTGLRIGAATAKGLAFGFGRGLQIVPVSTLNALAYNVSMWHGAIVPMLDARRGQVYTALYNCARGQISRQSAYMACDADEIIAAARDTSKNAIFLGDGAIVHGEKIAAHGFSIAPHNLILQSAASVGAVALQTAHEAAIEPNKFEPIYIRPSQAERLSEVKGQKSEVRKEHG